MGWVLNKDSFDFDQGRVQHQHVKERVEENGE
jgi:hypothetical protein